MLQVNHIQSRYGQVTALHDVDISVQEGEIVVLLGVNGAGKSTTLKTISGLLHPTQGEIHFDGKRIDRMLPELIVRGGIAHVPEGRHVFPGLTVQENLVIGTSGRRVTKAEIARDIDYVLDIFPDLKRLYKQMSWSLSGGQQQMLAIGRGLMAKPRLLMLDEPSLGLAPVIIKQVFATIERINKEGMTVLLVEQNVHLSLSIAHRAYLLETGRVVRTDTAEALRNDKNFKAQMLGATAH